MPLWIPKAKYFAVPITSPNKNFAFYDELEKSND